MHMMKGGQIQASGLDHLVGWPHSHAAVATNGCVPVVCESEAQRLAPIMTLQINTMMCGELASPGVRYSRVQQNISGLPMYPLTSMRGDLPFIHFPVVRITAGKQL